MTTAFAYGDGIGTKSYPAIEAFAARFTGAQLTVTQENPLGSGGFHGTGNAVDFSDGGNAGTPTMDAFAQYWYQYSDYLLELIHTNSGDHTTGYYVKNGVRVAGSFYGASLELQHENHVHVAATNHGIMAAMAGGQPTVNPLQLPGSDPQGTIISPASLTAQTVGSLNPLSGVASLYNFVTDPHNWIRLAEFIAGAFLLFLSIKALAESGKG